ncbi:MAG: prepilin-type N-terminal cleavage/methylation domain-containing protein [Candidatus Omnitrophica bacterium]|nr:prepilin-type N-terminal cleavage/methylation domain-containing protein [Candidatus Omnitrophota bacterium]
MRKKGLTLIELVIASSILFIVIAGIYSVYVSGLKFWDEANETADLQAEARNAMDFMVKELRNATRVSTEPAAANPNIVIPASPNNNQITFYLPADVDDDDLLTDEDGAAEWDLGSPVTYQVSNGSLVRVSGGTQRVLANGVTAVWFEDIDTPDLTLSMFEVRITLSMDKTSTRGRTLSYTLVSLARLRN